MISWKPQIIRPARAPSSGGTSATAGASREICPRVSVADSPAGSDHHVVERTLIGSGVVFAADLEARRVGQHAPNLFLAGRRAPVPTPAG
jgi:hypothetical protein